MRMLAAFFVMLFHALFVQAAFAAPAPVKMTIILERQYLDGEVSEETKAETFMSMKDIWKKYKGWQLVNMDDETLVFRKTVDDISPLLKANGYFGITEDGTLSIFEGKPAHSTRIIQSFFQIDVKKLESRQHEQLKRGIRVVSKSQYQDMIETYRHFAFRQ
ncbi:intercompartmental signaling factor BofC [Parageobacillus thermoglucosidasius]|uniref:intercompartmental signaling factor BofC n=1 Tax=Parageobacillus thermoglucosidasius TaxID=1426 RepID=UPI000B579A21|nr:intercompartmental signaling factor BofC [Parageobacillus thermoglucosidasius]MBY6267873.1 Forespore regulator of the sigma-K checkpoint, BofC [Parageobacillus thermoglucosidasius]OUM87409.1 MAG: Forespore regulator of the sigma-K checkpoint, BofC [Parageobacillus thermoglucosidasius]RDE32273.1 Forespore regulator of the sigma-K checkpoint, BofC [Parageobacillus thermoglucosidasius]